MSDSSRPSLRSRHDVSHGLTGISIGQHYLDANYRLLAKGNSHGEVRATLVILNEPDRIAISPMTQIG